MKRILSSCLFFFLSMTVIADTLRFSLHKLESSQPGPTLLVIGGIQGDEPGGFTAASLLVTDYQVTRGNVWIVPNLNFKSIIKRSRGVHGDMNRKFKSISERDPEYEEVQKIKNIILDKQVDIVLNLHDGSGFYKKTYINKLHNPSRWGQSIIIDQDKINADKYGDLGAMASKVQGYINHHLANKNKYFYVKNTRTREGDAEMEKTLTYFAINNSRPAFGIEASKSFLTYERSYYHLLAVEGFMKQMGIEYQRNFKLTRRNVARQIGSDLKITLNDDRIKLDVEKARPFLNYLPLKKHASLEYKKNNPLIAVIGNKRNFKVRYGNRSVTSIRPQYFDYDTSLNFIRMQVDGVEREIEIGGKVFVKNNFKILADNDYRVNVIGYTHQNYKNENRLLISRGSIKSRFSIDRAKKIFRVELYKGNKFSGMVLVNFVKKLHEYKTSSLENKNNNSSL